jgi:hypothetical protein
MLSLIYFLIRSCVLFVFAFHALHEQYGFTKLQITCAIIFIIILILIIFKEHFETLVVYLVLYIMFALTLRIDYHKK